MGLKKTWLVSLILLTLVFLSVGPGCAATKEIRVGLLLPLTGWASFFGVLQDCSFRVYQNEFKDKALPDGRVIKFIVYDTACKPQDAILMAQKLVHNDKVHQIIGPFLSTECEQVFPIVNQAQTPIITASSVKPGLAASNRPWTFRCIMTSEKINEPAVSAWVKDHGVKSVVILTDIKSKVSEDYGKRLAPTLLKKLGVQIKDTVDFTTDDVDFSAQITKAKAANPDGLVLAGAYAHAANLAREARKQGMKQPFLSDVPVVTDEYVNLGGPAVEGSYAPTDFWMGNPDQGVQKFVAAFKKELGKDQLPHTTSARILDALLITRHLMGTLDLSGKPEDLQKDREKIRDGWANLKDFPALSKISFDKDGEALIPDYSAGKQRKVCSVGQPHDMVKEIDRYRG
jgi:branched-chain amino acid transport system substrate-binding protein